MNILLFLIPISLVMIGVAAGIFVWAVRHGQFEDLDTPALDVLRDDETPPREKAGTSGNAAVPDRNDAD